MCDNPWIALPLILILAGNLFALIGIAINEECSAWEHITKDKSLRALSLGQWILIILSTPANIVFYVIKYLYKVGVIVFSWQPFDDNRKIR